MKQIQVPDCIDIDLPSYCYNCKKGNFRIVHIIQYGNSKYVIRCAYKTACKELYGGKK
mgnify:CR=1 FL=1